MVAVCRLTAPWHAARFDGFSTPDAMGAGGHARQSVRRRLIVNQVSMSEIVLVCQCFKSDVLRLCSVGVTPGYRLNDKRHSRPSKPAVPIHCCATCLSKF